MIVDEVDFMPLTPTKANLFLRFVSSITEKTLLIITSIKGFDEGTDLLANFGLFYLTAYKSHLS